MRRGHTRVLVVALYLRHIETVVNAVCGVSTRHCVGATLCTFGATAQVLIALQAGTFAGMIACLLHEAIASAAVRATVRATVSHVARKAAPYALGSLTAFALCV